MAENKNTNTSSAQTAAAPAAPTTPPAPPAKVKVPKGADGVEFVESSEKAIEIGKSRTEGARVPVEITDKDGKKRYAVGAHLHYVGMRLCKEQGFTLTEIGKEPKAGRTAGPVGMAGVLAAIDNLPENEKAAVLEQLETIKKEKAAKEAEAAKAAKAKK